MEIISESKIIARFAINLAAMGCLIFLLYYPRYKNKETAVTAALFNIFTFAILSVLSTVEIGLATGFGLFAMLAMFTVRSEQIKKCDMAYFFGSISLAVITSITAVNTSFAIINIVMVLVAVIVVDHSKLLKSVSQMKVTLDSVPEKILIDPLMLKEELSNRLGIEIISYRIISVCYVTEVLQAEVNFRP
jgi:hypothetical protein